MTLLIYGLIPVGAVVLIVRIFKVRRIFNTPDEVILGEYPQVPKGE